MRNISEIKNERTKLMYLKQQRIIKGIVNTQGISINLL